MSTPFKPEWLQPGAVVPADIPTLGAFADELRRVMQENEELRTALVQTMNLYNSTVTHRDKLFEKLIESKLKEKNA
jgi:hypothetical protein